VKLVTTYYLTGVIYLVRKIFVRYTSIYAFDSLHQRSERWIYKNYISFSFFVNKTCSACYRCEPGSSVSIVSGYGLYDRAIEVRFPAEAKGFSSSLYVQTGSGAHPASCTMGTGGPFPGAKVRPRRDADHSPPSSAEVDDESSGYSFYPQAPSWRVAGQL
jgi:hypothetical protein